MAPSIKISLSWLCISVLPRSWASSSFWFPLSPLGYGCSNWPRLVSQLVWQDWWVTYYFLNALVGWGYSVGSEEDSEALLNIRVLCGAVVYRLPQTRHSTVAKGCVDAFSRICRLNCSEWLTNHFLGRVVGGHACTYKYTPPHMQRCQYFAFWKRTKTSNYGFRKFKHGRLTLNFMANLFDQETVWAFSCSVC